MGQARPSPRVLRGTAHRRVARTALSLLVKGKIERSSKVVHVKAQSFRRIRLGEELPVQTRDFY